jgi:hypothetical protein
MSRFDDQLVRKCEQRVTQDGLVAVAENQIHGPQSMSGAFWGSSTALWSDFNPPNLRGAVNGLGRGKM